MPTKKSATKKAKNADKQLIPADSIDHRILLIRGQKVMLDSDLAQLYGVTTKRLNEQVKRNIDRFPEDFMFQLTEDEAESLRSQIVTSKSPSVMRSQIATASKRNIRYKPYAFTEHEAVMLASVLNSEIAIAASIQVVRAFVRLRSILAAHAELAKRLEALENKTDANFKVVYDLINKYQQPPAKPKTKIGF